MFSLKEMSSNRLFIYHLLRRSLRYHCPITACYEWDIQEVFDEMANHRNGDNPIGMTALTIKAMGDVLKEEPRLNARLFYSFFGRPRIAMYDHVSCSTVVARMNPAGEEVLLPLVVKNVDQLSIREVQAQLSDYKTQDLGALEAKTQGAKPKKLPAFIVKLLHYRFRTDPAFTEKMVGSTFAVSSVIQTDTGLVAGNTPANQTALFPTVLTDRVVVHEGVLTVRKVLGIGLAVDHYIVDGRDVVRAAASLQSKLTSVDYFRSKLDQA